MTERNSRQMFCTHCGEGLIDRQGKPALQVTTLLFLLKLLRVSPTKGPIVTKS